MAVEVGDVFEFRKTVGESDVYLFAGITGDLHPNHVNEEYMRAGGFGRRIAHGTLVLGLSSRASTAMVNQVGRGAVAYGFDRVRFVRPVFLGDTVTVRLRVDRIDTDDAKIFTAIETTNQHGDTVMAATYIVMLTDAMS